MNIPLPRHLSLLALALAGMLALGNKAEIELASEDESAVARVRSAIEDAGFDVADASRA